MLISLETLIKTFGLNIKGVIHIGAHECEELTAYNAAGITNDKILWFEGQKELCDKMAAKHPQIHIVHQVVSNKDGAEVDFIITNNYQSSSILELEKHKVYHPHIHEISRMKVKTKTIDSYFADVKDNKDNKSYNFVNIDIQGAELLALQGMVKTLPYVDYIYLEINDEPLYHNCALVNDIDAFLEGHGFFRVISEMTEYHWGDALYIRQDPQASTHKAKKLEIYGGLTMASPVFSDVCDPNKNGEMWIWNKIKSRSAGCNLLFDVGLKDSLTYKDEGKIIQHCFEPNVQFYNQVKAQSNDHVIINNLGLGKSPGNVTYYQHSESIKPRQHYKCPTDCSCRIDIKIDTVDNYCQQHSITHIDFIKIDTEGYELDVLYGADRMLNAITFVQFEYGGTYPDNNIKLVDVYKYLGLKGFKYIYLICPTYLTLVESPLENYQYSNYIATRAPIHILL